MHTVGKEREKLPHYALLFKYALKPLAYVEVQCVQNLLENGLVEPAKC